MAQNEAIQMMPDDPPVARAPEFSFVVPCYNEGPNLEPSVAEIEKAALQADLDGFEIILVNDCSADETGDKINQLAAERPHIRAIHNSRNLNLGGAYKAGIAAATGTYVMMVPGDNSHPAHGILPIIRAAGKTDMVLPYPINPEARTLFRRFMSRSFIIVNNVLFRNRVPYYNGLVVHKTQLLHQIPIVTNSFAYQAEAVVRLLKRGADYSTVGVEIVEREVGLTSAFRPRNIYTTVMAVLVLRWRLLWRKRFPKLKRPENTP